MGQHLLTGFASHQAERSALGALREVARLEGLMLGLGTAHVVAWVGEAASRMPPSQALVVLLKDRGEKDLWDIMRREGHKI